MAACAPCSTSADVPMALDPPPSVMIPIVTGVPVAASDVLLADAAPAPATVTPAAMVRTAATRKVTRFLLLPPDRPIATALSTASS